jgi:hypothetical protein
MWTLFLHFWKLLAAHKTPHSYVYVPMCIYKFFMILLDDSFVLSTIMLNHRSLYLISSSKTIRNIACGLQVRIWRILLSDGPNDQEVSLKKERCNQR